jgi:hypothetical protein
VGNAVRPANQQGRKTSPDIKRANSNLLNAVESLLDEEYNIVYVDDTSKESES